MAYILLTGRQRRALRQQLHQTSDAKVYHRTLVILEFARGRGVANFARLLHTSRQSAYRWLEAYAATSQPAVLADAPRGGRPDSQMGVQGPRDARTACIAVRGQAIGGADTLRYRRSSTPSLITRWSPTSQSSAGTTGRHELEYAHSHQ